MLLKDRDRIEELLTEPNQSIHRDPGKPPIAFEGDLQLQEEQKKLQEEIKDRIEKLDVTTGKTPQQIAQELAKELGWG